MSRRTTLLQLGLAMMLLAVLVGMVETLLIIGPGPASARPVAPRGTVTCDVSANVTFDPPLTRNGTIGAARDETMRLEHMALSACMGSTTPTGWLSANAVGRDVTVSVPAMDVGSGQIAGMCSQITQWSGSSEFEPKFSWTNGIKPTESGMPNVFFGESLPNVSLISSGSVNRGSFVGEPVQLSLYLNGSTSRAIVDCLTNTSSSASISGATIVPSLSSMTIG